VVNRNIPFFSEKYLPVEDRLLRRQQRLVQVLHTSTTTSAELQR
jgi:hypothetical protein